MTKHVYLTSRTNPADAEYYVEGKMELENRNCYVKVIHSQLFEIYEIIYQ